MPACANSSASPNSSSKALGPAYRGRAQAQNGLNKTEDGSGERRLTFLSSLIASTVWPRRPRRGVINQLPLHRTRARTIDCDGHGSQRGSFTSSRQGYGEVYFESALERSVLIMLDHMPESVSWYLEQPVAIPYIGHCGRPRTHYPDVLVATPADEVILVECKPLPYMVHLNTFEKGIVAIAHATARGWGYVICDDRGITPAVLAAEPSPAQEEELVAAVRHRQSMDVGRFRRMRVELGVTFREGAAALLRNDLVYDSRRGVVMPLPSDRSWRYLCASASS